MRSEKALRRSREASFMVGTSGRRSREAPSTFTRSIGLGWAIGKAFTRSPFDVHWKPLRGSREAPSTFTRSPFEVRGKLLRRSREASVLGELSGRRSQEAPSTFTGSPFEVHEKLHRGWLEASYHKVESDAKIAASQRMESHTGNGVPSKSLSFFLPIELMVYKGAFVF